MHVHLNTIIICCISLFLTSTLSANNGRENKPIIKWFHSDFPPVFIVDGRLKGQGYGDKTLNYFLKRMPAYEHKVSVASLKRSFANMQKQDGICEPALFKTPAREKIMKFSTPLYSLLTNQLVTLKKHEETFRDYQNDKGEIQLSKLLSRQDLSLGIVDQRIYSQHINAAIDKASTNQNIIRTPHDRYATLLSRGRIDYTFGFPAEAQLQFQLIGKTKTYTTMPIEGEPATVQGYIACSDMPLGREIIARINQIARAAGPKPAYWQFYEEWLDHNALETFYRARQ